MPKNKTYSIPQDKIEEYREITKKVPKEDLLIISRITNRFLAEIVPKKLKDMGITTTVQADMRKKGLKSREYIYSLGNPIWTDYINYLRERIVENYG